MYLEKKKKTILDIFVFAHALGTLAGAYSAAKLAANHHMKFALFIGVWFLAGGVAMVFILPAPRWFVFADLILAYLPMSYLGGKFGILRS